MAIIPLGGGGSENLKTELTTQETLIDEIEAALVGKATGADATADKILSPYKAYVGRELITGTYVPQVVTIDGEVYTDDLELISSLSSMNFENLPYYFYKASAVVLNNEIHILGSGYDAYWVNHYKWDGSSWTSVSTLPYGFSGSAVVLNNEIHILGSGVIGETQNHYKWNGSSWTSVSTLPWLFIDGSAVVLNGEIHILGTNSSSSKCHSKWNGSSWVSMENLPYDFYGGDAVIFKEGIHILGSIASSYTHRHVAVCVKTYSKC